MRILLLFFFLASSFVNAQDSFSVNYKYGRASIPNDQIGALTTFLKKYQKTPIDSIQFIGSSDSAGLFLSNFRMTEWRARKLRNLCSDLMKTDVDYRILPTENKGLGEVRDVRAVEIVIYPTEIEKKKSATDDLATISGCYRVAYKAMESCFIRRESKGKKGYVYLERYFPMSKTEKEIYYYGSTDESGTFVPKPLKWKLTKTGEQHWKGERYVAKIPESDFEKYKIFVIESEPCNMCHEDFHKNGKIVDNKPENKPDYVVMHNLQYHQPWIRKKSVLVRIPKEFIDQDFDYVSNRRAVVWTEKEKSPDYYFAKVSQSDGKVDLIHRPYRIPEKDICETNQPYEFKPRPLQCAPNKAHSEVINYVEVGMHNQNSTNYPYAAIGVFAGTSRIELEFLAGIHQKSAFYGAIRGRYNIVTAPFNAFLPKNSWRHSMTRNRFWYSRIYVGAEYKASIGRRSANYLEPNLNIGLSIAQNGNPTFQRFFVQYGKGVNFILESPHSIYSIFQFGVQIHLGKKEYLKEEGVL